MYGREIYRERCTCTSRQVREKGGGKVERAGVRDIHVHVDVWPSFSDVPCVYACTVCAESVSCSICTCISTTSDVYCGLTIFRGVKHKITRNEIEEQYNVQHQSLLILWLCRIIKSTSK